MEMITDEEIGRMKALAMDATTIHYPEDCFRVVPRLCDDLLAARKLINKMHDFISDSGGWRDGLTPEECVWALSIEENNRLDELLYELEKYK